MKISSQKIQTLQAALGISPELKLSKVAPQHLPFLAYHRARFYAAQAK